MTLKNAALNADDVFLCISILAVVSCLKAEVAYATGTLIIHMRDNTTYLNGVMENAGLENDGPTKIKGVENAGLENDGIKNRTGKCRTRK